MRTADEKMVLQALRAGGHGGINALVDAYGGYMNAIIARVCGDFATREDVEECVADCIVAVWKQAAALHPDGSLKAYVGAVARNRAIDLRRRCTGKELLPLEEDIIVGGEDVLAVLERKETATALQRELMAFPQPDREIFLRRYYLGEGLKAIGKALRLSERAVEGRLRRGRERLREKLGGVYDG